MNFLFAFCAVSIAAALGTAAMRGTAKRLQSSLLLWQCHGQLALGAGLSHGADAERGTLTAAVKSCRLLSYERADFPDATTTDARWMIASQRDAGLHVGAASGGVTTSVSSLHLGRKSHPWRCRWCAVTGWKESAADVPREAYRW